jgi:branched-chain amino acid transport system substrate-binding protein
MARERGRRVAAMQSILGRQIMRMRLKGMLTGLAITAAILAAGHIDAARAADDEIVIGAPISLTGPLAGDGKEQQWAYEQAIADINKAGGIMIKKAGKKLPVKLVVADDESSEAKVAAALENLIKVQKVDILLSTHSGPMNLAGAIVAEKYKKFYMITTAFPFEWQPHKFKYSALFFFHPGPGAEVPFQIWAKLPPEERPKRPALVSEDSPDGKGFAAAFEAAAKKYGYKFAVNDPWATGGTDYSALITKLKGAKVDAMLVFGSPADTITLVRQMKELGFSVPYFHGWKGTWTGEFHDALGPDSDYILTDGFWSESFPYTGAKELGQRYDAQFKKDSVTVGAFYANAQVLMRAIEAAGTTDAEAIHNAIFNKEFKDTVVGDLKFDATGFALIPSVATQWWHGRHQLIYPNGTWTLKLAPPWDKRS